MGNVLSHEYNHICRLDPLKKLTGAAVLCIHWFNPMVWVMYLLVNRDIELVCDENVVRQFGEKSRAAYSLIRINIEDKKSGLLPFCRSFSKNAIIQGGHLWQRTMYNTSVIRIWALN